MTPAATLVELCRVHSPSAMAVLDREMRYVYVSQSWLRDYDLGDCDLVGRSHYEVFPEIPEHWKAVHRRCLEGASERCDRDRLVRRDGTVEWVRWEIRPWRTEAGAIGGIVIFSELITQQKLLEDAHAEIARLLAEREQLLEFERAHVRRLEILRRSALAISALDADAAACRSKLLQRILDQARILTGADYGALGVGADPDRPFEQWVWSGLGEEQAAAIGARPRPVGLLGEIARDHRTLRLDDIRGAPGAIGLPAQHPAIGPLLGVPIRHRGEVVGNFYLAKRPGAAPFTRDDQATLELLADHAAIAIKNAKLYQQVCAEVRTREEALAIVSHDLKNPLNSIALREQLLVLQHGPALQSHAASVTRSVNEMRRMILGLLDVASLDVGNLRLDIRPVVVEELIHEIIDGLAPLAADRELALELRVEAPGTIELDRERMAQVLSNLLGNAIKFTPAGGRIELRVNRSATELLIAVADTGTGIEPDVLPHVFDRYFTTARGGHGTGLGLYIVKALVEALGGQIRVESERGHGTTFSVTIPLQGAWALGAPP